jgi:hypothetical protein
MQTKALGSGPAYYQEFDAQAGDIIDVRWQNGNPRHKTILSKANFDAGSYGGPGPSASDAASARWQVPSSGAWVVFVVAPSPPGNFTATASHSAGAPVQVYGPDKISYGSIDPASAKQMINRAFELANERRMNVSSREEPPEGLPPDPAAATTRLILDDKLTLAAQSHSMNMGEQDFFSHTGKDGSGSATRIGAVGFKATATGEIITAGHGTPEDAIGSWMTSHDGHRGNLLNPQWTHTGIGFYFKADDAGQANYRYYWTMVFANPQ